MEALINDPAFLRRLIRRRKASGADRFDEVWDGVYIVSPGAGDEHQKIGGKLYIALDATIESPGLGEVRQIPNVSDRQKGWRQNYRCPDVAVFLNGTSAICKGAYWVGGPDFAVEVISPYDRSRKKLDFYAKVGVKELLLVDRKPWALELYRLQDGGARPGRQVRPRSAGHSRQRGLASELPPDRRRSSAEDRDRPRRRRSALVGLRVSGGAASWRSSQSRASFLLWMSRSSWASRTISRWCLVCGPDFRPWRARSWPLSNGGGLIGPAGCSRR